MLAGAMSGPGETSRTGSLDSSAYSAPGGGISYKTYFTLSRESQYCIDFEILSGVGLRDVFV